MVIVYLDLNVEVIEKGDNPRNVDGKLIRLVNSGPIAIFSDYKLTASSGKHLENFNHAHFVSLRYQLLTSANGAADLAFGFDHDRPRRQVELTKNKNMQLKNHVSIMLEDVFGFAEHHENATYG